MLRVAHNIEIRLAGQTESLGDATPTSILKVNDQVGIVARIGPQLIAEIERRHLGCFVFDNIAQAVCAFIGRVEVPMHLKNAVRLTRDPIGCGRRMWKHCEGRRFRRFNWWSILGAAMLRQVRSASNVVGINEDCSCRDGASGNEAGTCAPPKGVQASKDRMVVIARTGGSK